MVCKPSGDTNGHVSCKFPEQAGLSPDHSSDGLKLNHRTASGSPSGPRLVGWYLGQRMGCLLLGPLGRQDNTWIEAAKVLELGLGLLQGTRLRPKLVGLLLETQVGVTPPGRLGRWCWQQKQYRAVAKCTQRWCCFQFCSWDHSWQTCPLDTSLPSQNCPPWSWVSTRFCNLPAWIPKLP